MAHRNIELCYIVSSINLRDQERETIDANFKVLEQSEITKLDKEAKWVEEYYILADQLDFYDRKRDELLWELKAGFVRYVVLTHIRLNYYRTKMLQIIDQILDKARGKNQPPPRIGRRLQPFEIHEMQMIAWFDKHMSKDCFLEGVKN
jgi:hypothetical protein